MSDTHEVMPDGEQDELTRVLHEHNQRLAALPPGAMPSIDLRAAMEEELDDLWPHADQYCAASGWGYRYGDGTGYTPTATEYHSLVAGVSHGFVVAKFGSALRGHWAVALDIAEPSNDDDEAFGDSYMLDTSGPYGLVPYGAVYEANPEGLEFPDIRTTLSRHSDELAEAMNDSKFYTLNRHEQMSLIAGKLKLAEQETERFDERIRGARIAIGAPRAYIYGKTGDNPDYVAIDIDAFNIVGTGDGLGVLAQVRLGAGMSIKSADDAINPDAGMCLQVKIDVQTATELNETEAMPFKFHENSRLLIPISDQEMDVVFDEYEINALTGRME